MATSTINRRVWVGSIKGAILPIATLMLVGLMIVPMPSLVLDIGFIANIMISLAVLMVALNAAKPLDFSSFPTVLLFATLLRLALDAGPSLLYRLHLDLASLSIAEFYSDGPASVRLVNETSYLT